MPTNCIFCRIIAGEIPSKRVYEDEDVVAFRDVNPQSSTHVLIVPRRHIKSITEIMPSDDALIGKLFVAASKIARDERVTEEGYRLVINNGPAAGQSVDHIHLHVLGGRDFGWPPG